MKSKTIDSTLVDNAIIFAVKAHSGVERKGSGFPYIIHPLEVLAIASSMSSDKNVLAASVLHDVIEDTSFTYEDILNEFNKEVADLVLYETNPCPSNMNWKDKKQVTINNIINGSKNTKIIALSDKLSNMRSIANDYKNTGDQVWKKFHAKDPSELKWYYNSLVDAFSSLSNEKAYTEFKALVENTFKLI